MEPQETERSGACRCGSRLGADSTGYCPECGGKRGVPITGDEIKNMQEAMNRQDEETIDRGIIDAARKIAQEIPREPGSVIMPPPEGAAKKVQDSLKKILTHRRRRRDQRGSAKE